MFCMSTFKVDTSLFVKGMLEGMCIVRSSLRQFRPMISRQPGGQSISVVVVVVVVVGVGVGAVLCFGRDFFIIENGEVWVHKKPEVGRV
jgi:hypothetical protein